MSDADWIEKAAQQVVDDVHSDLHICRSPSKSIADAIETIGRFHAAHIATCVTDKLAERIAAACYDADGTIISVGIVEELLAPHLARNAAMESVLRECRPVINNLYSVGLEMHFTHSSFDANDEKRRTDLQAMCDLLSRIDQLTAKGATAP